MKAIRKQRIWLTLALVAFMTVLSARVTLAESGCHRTGGQGGGSVTDANPGR